MNSGSFIVDLVEINALLGDLIVDGVVNVLDLLMLLNDWDECAGCFVDVVDLLLVIANWS